MEKAQELMSALVSAEEKLSASRAKYLSAQKTADEAKAELLALETARDTVRGNLKQALGF